MNKFNFNSIDNLEIPDSWAEKAIENSKKPRVVSVAKTTKILAFVASLVLVCGISVAMFFITNENAIPPVLESHPTKDSVYNETSKNQLTEETSKKQAGTETQSNSDSIEDNTQTIEPTEKVTTSPTVTPTQNKKPSADSTKPHSTQKPTAPQQTDSGDTSDSVPTEKPTAPVIVQPSKPPSEDVDPKNIYVNVTVYKHLVLDDGKIYCKVYDENGVLLGDPDLFSDEHLTELTYYSYYTAYYYPYRYSLVSKSGDYTFVFYNSNGEVARQVTKHMKYFEP